jgi:hypothetical protein
MPATRRQRARGAALALASALVLAALAAGCGSSADELDVAEGEPIVLNDLSYNVAITRFLNPSDPEDKAYLAGQPEPPAGKLYLAVFMRVHNQAEDARRIPTDFKVTDTAGDEYDPVRSDSLFALPLGANMAANATEPEAESTAANGVIEASMVLFLVNEDVTESRPLTLDIPSTTGDEAGEVELDI